MRLAALLGMRVSITTMDMVGILQHHSTLYLLTIWTEQSWGDDLESLGYVFLYFARGSLPWQGLKAATDEEKNELIKKKKMSLSGEQLCESVLPEEFAKYINYTRSLSFEDKPNYPYLRQLFRQLL